MAQFEVIVANNNPEEEVPEALALAQNMRVLWVSTPGSYAARNEAVEAAKGEIVFFTDSDCQPAKHWLSSGLVKFESDPDCRRIAGHVRVTPTNGKWNGWSVYDRVFRLRQDKYATRGAAVTANLAVHRSIFEDVGFFDETRFSGGDMEWNRRAAAEGVPLLLNYNMWVDHPARETYAECAGKVRRIAGARFASKAGRPFRQRTPRLKYIFPSFKELSNIWRAPCDAPMRAKLAAMWCHYAMGWVYNAEIVRLGFLGGAPKRS